MGLPLRIALPIFVVVATAFIVLMGYLVKLGLGDQGTALGSSVPPAQQGDAQIEATPAPLALATDPPGTYAIPQSGTGPVAQPPAALPGNAVDGGGPPAAVSAELRDLRAKLLANPRDLAALVGLAQMEAAAGMFDRALPFYRRALALDPTNPDVRTDEATALHRTGHDREALAQLATVLHDRPGFAPALYERGVALRAIGRRSDAIAAFRAFIAAAPHDPRVGDAETNINQLGG